MKAGPFAIAASCLLLAAPRASAGEPPEPAPRVRLAALSGREGDVHIGLDEDFVLLVLHRMRVDSDVGRLRFDRIVYRPLPGTVFEGLHRPRLYVDEDGDGFGEDGEHFVDGSLGSAIRFEDFDLALEDGRGDLLLVVRVTRSALAGLPFLPLLPLAAAAALIRRNRRRAAFAVLLIALTIVPGSGCNDDNDSSNLQLGLMETRDFRAEDPDTGERLEVEGIPDGGLIGPRVRLRSGGSSTPDPAS